MSRLVKGIASAWRADQVQAVKVRRKQIRNVSVDFNGAMPAGSTITEVVFDCDAPWIANMLSAEVEAGARGVAVRTEFNWSGFANIKATATLSTGDVINYEFEFTVTDAPIYPGATYNPATGPYSITATP